MPRFLLPQFLLVTFEFEGKIWYWKGPAPFYFVTVPDTIAKEIKEMESHLTYGWGMIPVTVTIGNTHWVTSLWPKDGLYIAPIKIAVRRAEGLEEGDLVTLRIALGVEA